MSPTAAFALLGAVSAISIGGARLVAWYLGYLDRQADAALRAARLLADAELEADVQRLERAWRIAPADIKSELHRYEIDASKRGDLIAAAAFAERSEVIRG